MYLYEKTTAEINTYTLVGNKDKIKELKIKELINIPLEIGAYNLKTKKGNLANSFYSSSSLKYNDIKRSLFFQTTEQTKQTREKYVDNDLNLGMPKVINCNLNNIYLFSNSSLENKRKKQLFKTHTIYTIDDIVIITRKLYLLHSFLRRDFLNLTEEDIKEFIKLCDFSHTPIKSIPLPHKDELLTEERLKIDAKILKKISR